MVGVLGYSSFCPEGNIGSEGAISDHFSSPLTAASTVLDCISAVKWSISDLLYGPKTYTQSTKNIPKGTP